MTYTKNIIVIPDVHGRQFWRKAVEGHEDDEIIFLGDYLDPYDWEGITPEDAWLEFEDIIRFKREHCGNVTLLLGNHDLGYLDRGICQVRMDRRNYERNHRLFEENLELFDVVHHEEYFGQHLLFSHAGFRRGWIQKNQDTFNAYGRFTPSLLNVMLHDGKHRRDLFLMLRDRGWLRGGYDDAGSPVWADIDEFKTNKDFLNGYLQIVGHSLKYEGPVMLEKKLWCLDCCTAFCFDNECKISIV